MQEGKGKGTVYLILFLSSAAGITTIYGLIISTDCENNIGTFISAGMFFDETK
jgi:hypothetical protein